MLCSSTKIPALSNKKSKWYLSHMLQRRRNAHERYLSTNSSSHMNRDTTKQTFRLEKQLRKYL